MLQNKRNVSQVPSAVHCTRRGETISKANTRSLAMAEFVAQGKPPRHGSRKPFEEVEKVSKPNFVQQKHVLVGMF